ncbi:hypothetical protein DH86_00001390 [Scytalidium sp. 3C]|nr:hypothetical protein DH86_00001390 [Scytalidium sp. 3C]
MGTEWHRHERDRNAWEIERQEMKGRIARLEGSTRKADSSNVSLKRYISMLEKALRERDAKLKALANGTSVSVKDEKDDRFAKRNLARPLEKPRKPYIEGEGEGDEQRPEDETDRAEMKNFMDKAQGELTYLMVAPSNPFPPREPPEESLQPPSFGVPQNQQVDLYDARQKQLRESILTRPSPQPNHLPPQAPATTVTAPARTEGLPGRTLADQKPLPQADEGEWPPNVAPTSEAPQEEEVTKITHTFDSYGRPIEVEEPVKETPKDVDGWDFNEAAQFPDPEPKPTAQRPDQDVFPVAQDPPKSPGRSMSLQKRKGSMSRRKSDDQALSLNQLQKETGGNFKIRFGLRGHLDVVRSVIFTGGGSPGEPEICTAGDDGTATLDGHTDAVWTVCVLPGTTGTVFGPTNPYGGPDRILLVSGAADGTVKVWSVSAPPSLMSPQAASTGRRGGRVRGNSMSSGSGFPSSPQPSVATNSPFHYTLIHSISRPNSTASPTCITPLSSTGEAFVVSYSDAAVLVYDTRTGEEGASMASLETYDGTINTGVNSIVATTVGLDSSTFDSSRGLSEEEGVNVSGATGTSGGIEGTIISGHEDRFIRFFDANSGQCTYNMLAHPAAISALSLSPDGRELVSAGHDASLRFWSLETRSCSQEITSHRLMRGEGVCSVVWSQDGRWVVSGGGDGVVKVFAR